MVARSPRLVLMTLMLWTLVLFRTAPLAAQSSVPLSLGILSPPLYYPVDPAIPTTYGVVNYQDPMNGPVGTITAMTIYLNDNPLPTVIYNAAHQGVANWDSRTVPHPSANDCYATATVVTTLSDGSTVTTYLDSRSPPPAGSGRRDDVIVAQFYIDRLQYDGGYDLYDRVSQRDVVKPQFQRVWDPDFGWIVRYDYPAGYVVGASPTVKFGLSVLTLNNLTARYDFRLWFDNESVPGYPFEVFDRALAGDMNNMHTLPALPNYVYSHLALLRIWIEIWFPHEQRWVGYPPNDTAIEGGLRWYATFADPNATFPRYKKGGTGAFQTKPWYHIISNALDHATHNGQLTNVTDPYIALRNLTDDLYVWPRRPDGPASSHYEPGDPSDPSVPSGPYYYLLDPPPPATPTEVVFDLWGMSNATKGDCQDFSAYLQCQARSLGIRFMTSKRLGNPKSTNRFWCNPLLFCGETAWRTGFPFVFHQVVYQFGITNGLYDWAFAFQASNARGWTLCIEYTHDDEKAALVSSSSPFQPGWGTAFALGETDPDHGLWTYVK